MTANVLHDKNACHLSVNGVVVATFNDVSRFNYLADKDTVKVIKTQACNMYGGNTAVTATWEISDTQ